MDDKIQIKVQAFEFMMHVLKEQSVDMEKAAAVALAFSEQVAEADDSIVSDMHDAWMNLPKEARPSRGRSQKTYGLEDGKIYIAKTKARGVWEFVRFDEYDDFSGQGGSFAVMGSEVPISADDFDEIKKTPIELNEGGE